MHDPELYNLDKSQIFQGKYLIVQNNKNKVNLRTTHGVRLSSSIVTVSDQRKNIYRRLHLENLVIKVKRQRQNERNLGSFLVKTHVLLFFLHLRKYDEKVQLITIFGFALR